MSDTLLVFTATDPWTTTSSSGTWWLLRPSHGDDDGPPTGVREPRRPHPFAPAGAAALELVPA